MKKFLLSLATAVVAFSAVAAEGPFYVVGAFQGWAVDAAPEMTKVGDKYELEVANMKSAFKILNAQSWDATGEWAAASANDKITLGTPFQLTAKAEGVTTSDLFFAEADEVSNAKLVLDPTNMTLTVTGTPVTGNPELWMVGGFTTPVWSNPGAESASPKFTETDGVYTLTYTFAGEFEFKIAADGWAPQWGLYSPGDVLNDELPDCILDKKAGSDPGNVLGDFTGDYKVTFDINTCEVVFEKAEGDGIEGVGVDANAPAVYYNLQGVQVANPTNGLYIVKQGNKVSKVLVK